MADLNTNVVDKHPPFKKNYPAFRLLGGNLISYIGDQIYLIAIPLMVLDITGSALSMGIISAIQRIPNLIQPLAGAIVDRINRKIILIICDFFRALLVAALGVLFLFDMLEMWYIYIASFIIGILSVLYTTAQFTVIPSIVNNRDLHLANTLESSSFNSAVFIGPTLGGIVISLYNPGYALLINSFSFICALVAILSIKLPSNDRFKKEMGGFFSELVEGFKYVMNNKIILYTNIALLISNFGTNLFLTILVIHLKGTINLDATSIGLLLSIGGLGAILGSLITNKLVKIFSYKTIFLFAFCIGGLSVILFGIAESYVLLVISNLLGTVAASAINPCIRTIRQKYTPSNLLGRVQATSRFITWILLPLAAFLSGYLSDLIGTSTVIIIGGIIGTSATLVFLHPKVRKITI